MTTKLCAFLLILFQVCFVTREHSFRSHPFLEFDMASHLTADVELADADGDGDLDVFAANGRHWAQQDFVFLNSGNGRMLEANRIGDGLGATYTLQVADLDDDGDVDVVAVRDSLPVQVFSNDGSGRFRLEKEISGTGGAARSAILVDVNRDDKADLVVVRRSGPDLLCLGTGTCPSWKQNRSRTRTAPRPESQAATLTGMEITIS